MKISGVFKVEMTPKESTMVGQDGNSIGRMALDKEYQGELSATSKGEMISAMSAVQGSAGYVAIEQVTGTLSGKKGSFVLQHFGKMSHGNSHLILEVVPDSGSGDLTGLMGSMNIRVEEDQHFYDFEYDFG